MPTKNLRGSREYQIGPGEGNRHREVKGAQWGRPGIGMILKSFINRFLGAA